MIDKYNAFTCKNRDFNRVLGQWRWKAGKKSHLKLGHMTNVLIVCMGNICRSPMAQFVLEKQAAQAQLPATVRIDSAGTQASGSGERPDPRAVAALLRRGYEMGRHRARRVVAQDFDKFDLILAMDADNLKALQKICPEQHLPKLKLFLSFGRRDLTVAEVAAEVADVPDPYYGNVAGFERVLDLCESGTRALIQHWKQQQN